MKKIKILHLCKHFYTGSYGGVEFFVKNLTEGLNQKSIDHIILCHNKKKNILNKRISKNIKLFSIKENIELLSTPMSINYLKYFYILSKKVNIIHLNYPYPFGDIATIFSKKKILTTYHSDIIKQKVSGFFYQNIFFNLSLRKSKYIIATSKNYLNSSQTLQKLKKKSHIINFGILKKKINKTQVSKKKYFIFIGNNRYYKNLNLLIEVVKKNSFNLKIITNLSCKNHKLKESLIKYKNISFYFDISEKHKYNLISNSICLILPSHLRSEAFGLALLEGLSLGKPLISCEIGTGTSFVNKHNETGYVIKPNNFNSLNNAMKKMIFNNNYKKFGHNCLKRYSKYFKRSKMCSKYLAIYNNLLNASN